ncbi:MAG: hypothetical protein K8R36_05510 [Planctomycetales bacterium]|nr:hypothetical protein [Planctomycetales bacterium]
MARRLKWYQFTLRSLLVVFVLAAICAAAYRYRQSYLEGKQLHNLAEGLRLAVHGYVDDAGNIEVRCVVINHSGKSRALLANPSVNFGLVTRDGVEHMDGVNVPNTDAFARRYVVVSPTRKGETKLHPDESLFITHFLKVDKDETFVGGTISATVYLCEVIPNEKEGLAEVEYSLEGKGDLRKAATKK